MHFFNSQNMYIFQFNCFTGLQVKKYLWTDWGYDTPYKIVFLSHFPGRKKSTYIAAHVYPEPSRMSWVRTLWGFRMSARFPSGLVDSNYRPGPYLMIANSPHDFDRRFEIHAKYRVGWGYFRVCSRIYRSRYMLSFGQTRSDRIIKCIGACISAHKYNTPGRTLLDLKFCIPNMRCGYPQSWIIWTGEPKSVFRVTRTEPTGCSKPRELGPRTRKLDRSRFTFKSHGGRALFLKSKVPKLTLLNSSCVFVSKKQKRVSFVTRDLIHM